MPGPLPYSGGNGGGASFSIFGGGGGNEYTIFGEGGGGNEYTIFGEGNGSCGRPGNGGDTSCAGGAMNVPGFSGDLPSASGSSIPFNCLGRGFVGNPPIAVPETPANL